METQVSFPLYNYKFKILGLSLATTGLIMLVFSLSTSFFPKSAHQVILWSISLGLFLVVFTREKKENRKIREARSFAFKVAFGFILSLLLSLELLEMLAYNVVTFDLSLIALFSLIVYLIFFRISSRY